MSHLQALGFETLSEVTECTPVDLLQEGLSVALVRRLQRKLTYHGLNLSGNDVSDLDPNLGSQTPLDDLDFSIRTQNCLQAAGIEWLEELTDYTAGDLLSLPNLRRKSAEEIRESLDEYTLELKGEPERSDSRQSSEEGNTPYSDDQGSA